MLHGEEPEEMALMTLSCVPIKDAKPKTLDEWVDRVSFRSGYDCKSHRLGFG
jgi:hypothetical protein